MQILKITEHEPVLCPALNKKINIIDCYETRFGISNILESIGIDDDTAIMKVCNKCSVGKKEYVIKRTPSCVPKRRCYTSSCLYGNVFMI